MKRYWLVMSTRTISQKPLQYFDSFFISYDPAGNWWRLMMKRVDGVEAHIHAEL